MCVSCRRLVLETVGMPGLVVLVLWLGDELLPWRGQRKLQLTALVRHTIFRICSGVGGFGGSLPAERVARGGVAGLSAMFVGCEVDRRIW
jgi:hypothetical protein